MKDSLKSFFVSEAAAERTIALLSIWTIGVIANSWVLSASNYFALDDFQWMRLVSTRPMELMFTLLPHIPYNDRPIGVMLLRAAFQTFGLHYRVHHAVLLFIHLVNSTLVYQLGRTIRLVFRERDSASRSFPACAAIVFAAWPVSVSIPTSWDAAIFDLLACTFSVCTLLFYFRLRQPRYSIYDTVIMCTFYILALRTKEMAVVVPFIAALFELLARPKQVKWSVWFREARVVRFALLAVPTLFYGASIITARARCPALVTPGNPYFLSFQPRDVLVNILKYIVLYWDVFQAKPRPVIPYGAGWIFVAFFTVVLAGAIYLRVTRRTSLPAVLLLAALFQLLPVLPMREMQHRLYLYLPSVFMSLGTGAVLVRAVRALTRSSLSRTALSAIGIVISISLVAVASAGGMRTYRKWWCEIGRMNLHVASAFIAMPPSAAGKLITVVNVPPEVLGVGILSAGEGDFLRYLYHDPAVRVKLLTRGEPYDVTQLQATGPVVDYNGGDPIRVAAVEQP